jgi:ABC-type thiamine transport system ATPase subunit
MKKTLCLIAGLLAATPAQAISITNLDDEPHTLLMEEPGGARRSYVLQENEVYNSLQAKGEVWLQTRPGNRMTIRQHDRLVIWPSGTLQLQKRRNLLPY